MTQNLIIQKILQNLMK